MPSAFFTGCVEHEDYLRYDLHRERTQLNGLDVEIILLGDKIVQIDVQKDRRSVFQFTTATDRHNLIGLVPSPLKQVFE